MNIERFFFKVIAAAVALATSLVWFLLYLR